MSQNFMYVSGSRQLPKKYAPVVSRVVHSALCNGFKVVTGCAKGADYYARLSAGKDATVFYAKDYKVNGRVGVASFVRRSLAGIRRTISGDRFGAVGFPFSPPPPQLRGSPLAGQSSAKLTWPKGGASGSGTWGSLWAFVTAMGPYPEKTYSSTPRLIVFPCGWSPDLLPDCWGEWMIINQGAFTGGYVLHPYVQARLM